MTSHAQKVTEFCREKMSFHTVFLLVFIFCQLYFTISQNYFIFTSL
jgi:asparagine N-glycosylation enzyme membrane subunit Stt3